MCGSAGCRRRPNTADKAEVVMVIRRVTHTVRAIDPASGEERFDAIHVNLFWKFSSITNSINTIVRH